MENVLLTSLGGTFYFIRLETSTLCKSLKIRGGRKGNDVETLGRN